METVVVAIVVGAFSGLLGSIAGPLLSHKLDRRRRAERRREERNLDLRRMIEVVMRLARMASSDTSEIELVDTTNGDLAGVLQVQEQRFWRLESEQRDFTWRPHRIDDQRLRDLATALNLAQGQLSILIGARRGVPWFTGTWNWAERVRNVRRWVNGLLEAVDRRMDELGW